jgi:hypothetical protein
MNSVGKRVLSVVSIYLLLKLVRKKAIGIDVIPTLNNDKAWKEFIKRDTPHLTTGFVKMRYAHYKNLIWYQSLLSRVIHHIIHASNSIVFGMKRVLRKNSSFTLKKR